MAANPSKIAALASQQADNSNNDSKQLSELEKAKQEKEDKDAFEQFQHDWLVQKPELVSVASEYRQELHPFSTIFPREITNLTLSYMRDSEIPQLGAIAPSILFACRSGIYEIMRFRKLASENLLPHVFGANPAGVEEFLRTSGVHPKILLTESYYTEGYQSKKLNKFVCFRRYRAVSTLIGFYRCADFRAGRRILALMLRDNNLSHEERDGLRVIARAQLIELSERITHPINAETVTTKTSTVPTMAKANANATVVTTTSAATAVSSNNTANNKEKAELNSGSSANTDEFADSLEFLSAIIKLINAYKAYTSQYDSLAAKSKWTEIDALWAEVCECHKRLYHYVHLEFFGPTPFSPLSPELFIAEPPRGPCRYYNDEELDLDEIGVGTLAGLYKGALGRLRGPGWRLALAVAQLDLAAMSHLYKLRVDDLRNTINQLHSLESALIFLNDVKPALRIDF